MKLKIEIDFGRSRKYPYFRADIAAYLRDIATCIKDNEEFKPGYKTPLQDFDGTLMGELTVEIGKQAKKGG
jgi:hypothetical protein